MSCRAPPEGAQVARRAAGRGVRSRSRRGRAQRPGLGHALLDEGGVRPRLADRSSSRASDEAEATAGDRAACAPSACSTSPGYVLGGGPRDARARLDRRARRAARAGRRADRRAREGRARLRLHRRQPQHPVSPARARRGRPAARQADRHHLRDGPARRDRREHPRGARLRRPPGRGTAASTAGPPRASRRSSSAAAAR